VTSTATLAALLKRKPRKVAPLDPKRASLKRKRATLAKEVAAFLHSQAPKIAAQIGAMLDARWR